MELDRLMDSSAYKETHREAMVLWSESIRADDPGYFCRQAISEATPNRVWLVVDARRRTDMDFFKNGKKSWKVLTVRVVASEEVRRRRGWQFVTGIDDARSECGLDDYSCNVTVPNDAEDKTILQQTLEPICQWVHEK